VVVVGWRQAYRTAEESGHRRPPDSPARQPHGADRQAGPFYDPEHTRNDLRWKRLACPHTPGQRHENARPRARPLKPLAPTWRTQSRCDADHDANRVPALRRSWCHGLPNDRERAHRRAPWGAYEETEDQDLQTGLVVRDSRGRVIPDGVERLPSGRLPGNFQYADTVYNGTNGPRDSPRSTPTGSGSPKTGCPTSPRTPPTRSPSTAFLRQPGH
jgi:hypothetical protein